jgi:hypothetical protein
LPGLHNDSEHNWPKSFDSEINGQLENTTNNSEHSSRSCQSSSSHNREISHLPSGGADGHYEDLKERVSVVQGERNTVSVMEERGGKGMINNWREAQRLEMIVFEGKGKLPQFAREHESTQSHENRPRIDPEHHLVLVHFLF